MRKWLLALLGLVLLVAGCQSLKYLTVGFYDPAAAPDSTAVAEEDST